MVKNQEEVLKIAKKLEKMVEKKTTDSALDILKALKAIPISLETLQRTRIGMLVNNVRKQTSNDEVSQMAKQLIKGWKKTVAAKDNNKSDKVEKNDDTIETKITSSKDKPATSKPKTETPAKVVHDEPIEVQPTYDPIRDKCRDMLLRGLQVSDNVSTNFCARLAASIEDAIFMEFKDTGVKYKNRIRSRFSNLKDPKNTNLRMMVLTGAIKPEKLAKMTAEELASDELKKQREKFEEDNIKDHQMAVNEGTVTDMFTCGRCKGKSCTYNQLQTRSSDEPMTTFVFCNDCGNRWKFC